MIRLAGILVRSTLLNRWLALQCFLLEELKFKHKVCSRSKYTGLLKLELQNWIVSELTSRFHAVV